MSSSSIQRSVITSPEDTLTSPSEFTTPEQLSILQNPEKCDLLGIIHHKEFHRTKSRNYLENAIFCARKATEICPEGNPQRKKYLFRLANFIASKCDRYEETEGLDEALRALEQCLKEDEVDSNEVGDGGGLDESRRADTFGCVARCRRLLYLQGGARDDFDATVEANENALSIYGGLGNGKKYPRTKLALAVIYEDRYKKEGSLEYLDEAIDWAREVLRCSEELDFWGQCVQRLADLCVRRYTIALENKDEETIRDAIEFWEDLFAYHKFENEKAAYQFEVGRAYFCLTKITKSSGDGSEASSNIVKALQSTPGNDPAREERNGVMEECFDFLSETVGFDFRHPPTNAEIKAKKRLILPFDSEEGSAEELDEEDWRNKAKLLEELAFMHHKRYDSSLATHEALAARDSMEKAVLSTPDDNHLDQTRRLRSIAFFCHVLYRKEDNPKYLDEGIPWARKAADICENSRNVDNPLKALTMHTLARMLASNVEEYGSDDRAMMMDAIEYGKKAVELVSEVCNGDDDCEDCPYRKMFVKDLEFFQQIFDRVSATASSAANNDAAP